MKKILASMLLTLGALALTAPTALAQATQKKEIKDQAEYNAYVPPSRQRRDAKISDWRRFRGLSQQRGTGRWDGSAARRVQQTNNATKVEDVAQRLLVVNPNISRPWRFVIPKKGERDWAKARAFAERGQRRLGAYAKPDVLRRTITQTESKLHAVIQQRDWLLGVADEGFCHGAEYLTLL